MPGTGPIIGLPSGPKVKGPLITSFMPASASAGIRSKLIFNRSEMRSRSGGSKSCPKSSGVPLIFQGVAEGS